jgi:hypothetical protein
MKSLLATIVGLSILAGCATSKYGTKDYLYLISEPEGASVTTSLGDTCVAPCTMVLPRRSTFSVTFQKDGYQSWTGQVSHRSRQEIKKEQAAVTAMIRAGNAAQGAATGVAAGVVAAGATGQLGLTLGGGVGATSGGAALIGSGLVLGAAAPLAVDAASGANRALWPNPVHVRLAPIQTSGEAPK